MDVLFLYTEKIIRYLENLFRPPFFLYFLSVEIVVVGSFKRNECGVRSAQWAYGPHCRTVVVPLIANRKSV